MAARGGVEPVTEPYQQLEQEWATFNDLDPAGMVACSSGTAALHLALEALGLPRGSKILVPDFTFVSCARAVTLAGLVPQFVDCRDDLLMDPGVACREMARQPESVMAVHVHGRRCDMDWIAKGANTTGTWLIEDLAQAHGLRPHPDADAACWSFHRTKVVCGEEGGAVWFRDPGRAKLSRCLRSCGQLGNYIHAPRGHNYRLANLLAAPILRSLRNYQFNLEARRRAEAEYDARCPEEWRMPPRDVPWVYDLRVPGLLKQAKVVRALNEAGISARCGFIPMTRQEEYRRPDNPPLTGADRVALEVFSLPLSPGITAETARRAFETIRVTLGKDA